MFDEVQIDPTAFSYGSTGGPSFRTTVVTTASGAEQRIAQWRNARRRYALSIDARTQAQLPALLAFFLARQGRARGFRLKDWTDYQAAGEPLVNNGATTLQLQKTYGDGSNPVTRAIAKPALTGITLMRGSAILTPGTDYTLDMTTGIVTLSAAAPGAVFSWTGEFDVPVRFDTDEMTVAVDDFDVRSWSSIPLIEVLV